MFFRKRQKIIRLICVLPQSSYRKKNRRRLSGRMSLCTLHQGSLTVEAALVLPFFLLMLLAFFSLSDRYVQEAELQTRAMTEAKTIAVLQGAAGSENSGRIVIQKSAGAAGLFRFPFVMEKRISARAVCRAWIGFRGSEDEESKVYITPDGNVYHLSADCTHLDLSIRQVPFAYAQKAKTSMGKGIGNVKYAKKNFRRSSISRRKETAIIRKKRAAV